jgi:putative FmdB family regulatory protein
MPTYEYACDSCGHQWDLVQRITEAPVELCPQCAKATAHRLISGGTRFILKGGGWYSDLYASPKPAADSSSEEKAADKKTESAEPRKAPEAAVKSESNGSESKGSESKASASASTATASSS